MRQRIYRRERILAKMVQVNERTNVGELLTYYPDTRNAFRKFGISCVG